MWWLFYLLLDVSSAMLIIWKSGSLIRCSVQSSECSGKGHKPDLNISTSCSRLYEYAVALCEFLRDTALPLLQGCFVMLYFVSHSRSYQAVILSLNMKNYLGDCLRHQGAIVCGPDRYERLFDLIQNPRRLPVLVAKCARVLIDPYIDLQTFQLFRSTQY